MPQDHIDHKSMQALVMAWCHQISNTHTHTKNLHQPKIKLFLYFLKTPPIRVCTRFDTTDVGWPVTLEWGPRGDVIMSMMVSQITSISIVSLTVCSGADQSKHQSLVSLAFVRSSLSMNSCIERQFSRYTKMWVWNIHLSNYKPTPRGDELTHWGWGKMAAISQMTFQMYFSGWKFLYFDSNFTEVCSKGSIDDKLASVQVMTCRQTGDKPLPEPILTQFTNTYMQH